MGYYELLSCVISTKSQPKCQMSSSSHGPIFHSQVNSIIPIKVYMDALQELLQILINNLSESSANDPENITHKEFTALLEVKVSPLQRIQKFFKLLFKQDDIKNFFLRQTVQDKASKASKKLGNLITSKVADMISSAPEESLTSKYAKYFKEKTLECICMGELSTKDTVILSCMAAFSKHFTSQEVSMCLKFLLQLSVQDLIKDQKLTSYGQWIVSFTRTLLKETSDVFISKCSMDILRSLVKLIQETRNTGTYVVV